MEWENLLTHHIGYSNGRTRLKTYFDDLLSKKLHKLGVKCILRNNYNWIKKDNSRKKSLYWRGNFSCQDASCDVKYVAVINEFKIGFPVSVVVSWTNDSVHNQLKLKTRCSGGERSELANKIIRDGVDMVKNDNEILNFLNPEC